MEHPTLDGSDGFPARLRYVVNSYGSTNALAGAIQRSEGAIRKWMRGISEPTVSDLRAICEATKTNVEWLVTGRGDPKGFGIRSPAPCSGTRAVRVQLQSARYFDCTRSREHIARARNITSARLRLATAGSYVRASKVQRRA